MIRCNWLAMSHRDVLSDRTYVTVTYERAYANINNTGTVLQVYVSLYLRKEELLSRCIILVQMIV